MVDTAHEVEVQWSGVVVGEGRGVPLGPLGLALVRCGPLRSCGVRRSAKVPPDHVIYNVPFIKDSTSPRVLYKHMLPSDMAIGARYSAEGAGYKF